MAPSTRAFPARLRSARGERTQLAVATALGLKKAAYGHIETGTRGCDLARVVQLAELLGVLPAWLAYGVREPGSDQEGAGRRLQEARTAAELTRSELAARAGYRSRHTVAALEDGTQVAEIGQIERLAEVLGVLPAWLAFGAGSAAR